MKTTFCLLVSSCLSLGLCSCSSTREVTTKCLRDTLIAAAVEAQAAGIAELNYEGSVTTTTNGNVSVVVPVAGLAPNFSFGRSQAVASKVSVKVPVARTAAMRPTGQNFKCNLGTLEARGAE